MLKWEDLKNGESVVDANDINKLAHTVLENESRILKAQTDISNLDGKKASQEYVDKGLSRKLSISTVEDRLYGTDSIGAQVLYPLDQFESVTKYGVVRRDENGHIILPITKPLSNQAVPKFYVDDIFDELKNRIDYIEENVTEYKEDEGVLYKKNVPSYSQNKAFVNYLGGMTYKVIEKIEGSNNLIEPDKFNMSTPSKNNGDGTITFLSGELGGFTYGANEYKANYNYLILDKPLPEGFQILIWDEYDNGIQINPGESYASIPGEFWSFECTQTSLESDITIGFMLSETLLPYEPAYREVLRDTKVTAIESYGANLYNGEQEISCNKTDTGKTIFKANITDTVTFSFKSEGTANISGNAMFEITQADGTTKYSYLQTLNPITLNGCQRIKIINWAKLTGKIFNIMLNYGASAAPYKPYREPITYPISKVIQNLEGYGQSNPDNTAEYNNVDFEEKIFIQKGKLVDGVWVANSVPITTNISVSLQGFDGLIEVEGGGMLKFVNEYENAVPSLVSYIVLKEILR